MCSALVGMLALSAGCSLDVARLRGVTDTGALPDAHVLDGGQDAFAVDAFAVDAFAVDAFAVDAPTADAPPLLDSGPSVPTFDVLYMGALAAGTHVAVGHDAFRAMIAVTSSAATDLSVLSRTTCAASVGSPLTVSSVFGDVVTIRDLDHDGALDVLSADSSYLRYGFISDTFTFLGGASGGHSVSGGIAAIGVADLAENGLEDVVLFENGSRAQWFSQSTARSLTPAAGAPAGSGITVRDGLAFDLSGDGHADILRLLSLNTTGEAFVSITPGNGAGAFGGSTMTAVGTAKRLAMATDRPGLVAVGISELHRVDPIGSVVHFMAPTGSVLNDVVAADLDGTSPEEIVVSDTSGFVRVLHVESSVTTVTNVAVPELTHGVGELAAVDIDGDGLSEIVLQTSDLLWILGMRGPGC